MDQAFKEFLPILLATKSMREDNIPCKIEEGLYLGSFGAASNRSALESCNITHILTIFHYPSQANNDFVSRIIDIPDKGDAKISLYFDDCFEFIDKARENGRAVLVHCLAGKSRSVTIVVAYLMKKNGMSLSQALEHVMSRRPVASPNSGFISQLQDFEKTLDGTDLSANVSKSNVSKSLEKFASSVMDSTRITKPLGLLN